MNSTTTSAQLNYCHWNISLTRQIIVDWRRAFRRLLWRGRRDNCANGHECLALAISTVAVVGEATIPPSPWTTRQVMMIVDIMKSYALSLLWRDFSHKHRPHRDTSGLVRWCNCTRFGELINYTKIGGKFQPNLWPAAGAPNKRANHNRSEMMTNWKSLINQTPLSRLLFISITTTAARGLN